MTDAISFVAGSMRLQRSWHWSAPGIRTSPTSVRMKGWSSVSLVRPNGSGARRLRRLSTSITIDLGLLMIPLCMLMVLEARRLGIRFVWLYIVLGLLIAISMTYPLFLIARELRLKERGDASPSLGWADTAALAALAIVMIGVTVRTFF